MSVVPRRCRGILSSRSQENNRKRRTRPVRSHPLSLYLLALVGSETKLEGSQLPSGRWIAGLCHSRTCRTIAFMLRVGGEEEGSRTARPHYVPDKPSGASKASSRLPPSLSSAALPIMGSSSCPGHSYDYSFKILLIGDSGVGKSSLLVSFISNHLGEDLAPTIGLLPFSLPPY
ncbi:hypothetical protein GW17_00017378 [Ensete ventricosum]|nr:hypothetical protein GW17_00017378 [Ensete ventricosum]